MDQLLQAFFEAAETRSEQEQLAELLKTHAGPIIRRIVLSRLSGLWDDIDDVCSETQLELLLHLRRLKAGAAARSIDDFEAYVAGITGNSCNHYFRRRRPGRARIKNQIRYLLQHDPDFRLSEASDGCAWCGLAEWDPNQRVVNVRVLDDLARQVDGERDLATLLRRIFERTGGVIELEGLVAVVARIWHIAPDLMVVPSAERLEAVPAVSQEAEQLIDRRRYAAQLWAEIKVLPRPQRVALLLNLRDGRGNSVLSLFPLFGIATFRELAEILDVSQAVLASLWTGLPCDDNTIGEMLGCARQQVINLRMAARKRLANRLREAKVI
jgi:DNA-directed RNA polymerase specialized sigma24 family protein